MGLLAKYYSWQKTKTSRKKVKYINRLIDRIINYLKRKTNGTH